VSERWIPFPRLRLASPIRRIGGMTLVNRSVSFCRSFRPDRPERSGRGREPARKGIHTAAVTEGTAGFPPPCGEVSAKRRVGVLAPSLHRLSLTPPPPPPPHKGEEGSDSADSRQQSPSHAGWRWEGGFTSPTTELRRRKPISDRPDIGEWRIDITSCSGAGVFRRRAGPGSMIARLTRRGLHARRPAHSGPKAAPLLT
jgi:hypothetical protein